MFEFQSARTRDRRKRRCGRVSTTGLHAINYISVSPRRKRKSCDKDPENRRLGGIRPPAGARAPVRNLTKMKPILEATSSFTLGSSPSAERVITRESPRGRLPGVRHLAAPAARTRQCPGRRSFLRWPIGSLSVPEAEFTEWRGKARQTGTDPRRFPTGWGVVGETGIEPVTPCL